MLAAITRLVTGRPKRVLIVTAAFFVVAAGLGVPVAGLLSVHPDTDFVDTSSENSVTTQRLEDLQGRTLSPGVIVLVRGDGPRSARGRSEIRRVAAVLRRDRAVALVKDALPGGPQGQAFASRDRRASFLAVFLKESGDEDDATRIAKAMDAFPYVQTGGLQVAGPQVGDQVSADLGKAELLAFPLLFLLSLIVFRGAVAALLPLFVGFLTIMATFLGLRIINEMTSLSIFALNLAIGLGLGLAIDYSLFILSRYREEVERVGAGREAMTATLRTAGRTVIFSSLTVAAAMLALLVFPERFLYSMAISGALTALSAGVIALTALTALITVLGDRVNALAPKRWRYRPVATESGFWYRLSHLVMRRPVIVATTTATLLIVAGLPFTRIAFTGVDASVLPNSAEPKQVDSALRREFPPGRTATLHVAVTAPRSAGGAMRDYAARLRARRDVGGVDAPQFLGSDTWQVEVVPAKPALNRRSLDLVPAVRAGPAPGPVTVAGDSARFVDQRTGLADRLPLAIAFLAITTLVILFAMTGSVVLPIKALVMNLLGLSAAFGVLVLIFQDGRLEGVLGYTSQGALEITQPLVLLAIAFGLSTDYGVFLLTRIKEARDQGASNEEAVALGIQRTGRIVTAAALLLVVAIGAFATSQIIFIKELGIGTAVAVLIDATIVRALLVPALMKLLGERNWWAPRPLRRLHARFGVSEGADIHPRATTAG
ncbi:MAG: putative drug exporter of the superfamily [Solirubrobacteraceae bacterium]|jgi:RND superfamily putative drug exporter|nr:putative drug exporter of the superfamily [Solirubrobacteraceae bacterium]